MTHKRVLELREKQDSELAFDAKQLAQELFELRFKASAEGLANPSSIRRIRREIATIHTLLRERQLGIRGSSPRT